MAETIVNAMSATRATTTVLADRDEMREETRACRELVISKTSLSRALRYDEQVFRLCLV
ncbi:hypothetical protein EGYY_21170 [Eggerthella sp. YY7918]|nr:hypothetical protein EGYY_21170 [Eggerthella sp. YY7918]